MAHSVYILYSRVGDTFYVGESEDVERRVIEHNNHTYKGSQTTRYADWDIFLVISCIDRIHARKVEEHIKKMKSRKYYRDLKEYPEMVNKIATRYLE